MAERLADEPSPYLQQHKDNPVDWWPWGDAAFEEAARRDVPVFLSVGYSTCHWCHVMAHESFEDDDVAALLNEHFVPVKVDREERPDVDAAYMAVCQAMTGRGGWPLTVVLTPDRRPWFAGTYFPRASRPGMPGMLDLLPRLHEAWTAQREEVLHSSDHILEAVQRAPAKDGPQPSIEWSDRATAALKERFDGAHGGFGDAPKFPSPHQLRFLLRQWRRTGDGDALHMVEHTLDAMAMGGIHDHLGGGFHRYSTDARWHLPHFEKMLYDQATLLLAYTEAYQATGQERFRSTMEGIVTYLLRDLRHPEGAFFAAEDADSEGEEGRFYVWTSEEVQAVLGDDAARFITAYDVRPEGNFHDEVTRKPSGKNILHRSHPDAPDDLEAVAALEEGRKRMLHARSQRVRPHRDEKVLTDWNGLAIAALAKAGAALGRSDWIQAAADAARFLLGRMRPDGRLRHRFCAGVLDDDAFLDDHAFLAWGLLELFTADGDATWLQEARTTTDSMLERFRLEDGALALAPRDGERLVVETAEAYDGALPSGDSVAVQVLWRLGRIIGEPAYEDAALGIARAFATTIERMPAAFTELLCGLQPLLTGGREVVISGDGDVAEAMLAAVRRGFHPDAVLIHRSADAPALMEQASWLTDYVPGEDGARAYVCTDHACQAPVTRTDALRESLA